MGEASHSFAKATCYCKLFQEAPAPGGGGCGVVGGYFPSGQSTPLRGCKNQKWQGPDVEGRGWQKASGRPGAPGV